MNVFETLTTAERAKQLSNPEGATGIAVAEWLNENNRQANRQIVVSLGIEPGNRVLEIGFGNGRAAPEVVAQATGVHYVGIDLSPTMVAEANRLAAALVVSGQISFHLGSAQSLPFADASFDRVFAIGVIHFWAEPVGPLSEVRRVLRPGGMSLMTSLHHRSAPDFARPEHGFHLRDASGWFDIYRAAGFADVNAETVEMQQINPDGTPTTRYSNRILARV